ncbi:hypothetical protein H6P81_006178 [Aristolochia fimbriata]|uniref:CCR4-NOT transcription complex subunit 4 n=1 Tax=Aristolochia fimbriata TaxID=158543 RepID=A0AAV7EXR5_ARIFI|nr:hypothetical protein H6P81_006178 [Aristolochia fimbriata]
MALPNVDRPPNPPRGPDTFLRTDCRKLAPWSRREVITRQRRELEEQCFLQNDIPGPEADERFVYFLLDSFWFSPRFLLLSVPSSRMTTMSDECERTCPLCAEEMDLTDQQLKPCKCGYEICVWCWHHIIDMAEKDDTEGRCPACRTPYDKEKIVGTAANCERMVAEINSERKFKSQKAKPKASEGRKHLSTVRVIQRNLVYVIGIPANLADEDMLERKEYFGQYGKVLKVSITRPTGGAQNSSSNNTVSVYITYTKEDEAVRCIQSVHGFTLDGRPLRACFGTTKYCHTWLRNMSCNNPDCLYLHEVGVQEDSFTKDEIISAYTRVQQITGVANNHFQRRAGAVLPPPADDFCNSGSAFVKPNVKNLSSTNSTTQVKVSPPNSSSGRSSVLPPAASWGLRGSNCRPPSASSSCTQGSTKQITNTVTSTVSPSLVPITASLSTLHSDVNNTATETDRVPVPVYSGGRSSDSLGFSEHSTDKESHFTGNTSTDALVDAGSTSVTLYGNSLTTPNEKDRGMSTLQEIGLSIDQLGKDPESLASNQFSPQQLGYPSTGFQQYHCDNGFHATEAVSAPLVRDNVMPESELRSRKISSWDFDSQAMVIPVASVHDDGGLVSGHSSCLSHSSSQYMQSNKIGNGTYLDQIDSEIASGKVDESSSPFPNDVSIFSNGYNEHNFNTVSELGKIFGPPGSSNSLVNAEREKNARKVEAGASEIDQNVESSIISSILSLDLDSWDDPMTSSSNLAKMFGESDRQNGPIGLPSSWKQNSQSKFSFARQEDLINQTTHLDPSLGCFAVNVHRSPCETRNFVADKHQNGFTACGYEDFTGHFNSQSISSSKAPAPRAQMSAPPGFSVSNRAPPGFSSQERLYSSSSGNPLENSLSRNLYQVPSGSMGSVGDVELIDPAILAVGKGRLPLGISNSSMDLSTHFPATRNSNDSDLRLRLLLQQQSLSAHQNYSLSDQQMDDGYSTIKDRFIASRLLGQSEENNFSHFSQMSLQSRNQQFSSGQWDSWKEVQNGNEMSGVAEFIRNERIGMNKYFSGYDELKVRMPSSGNLYNRAFGI